MCENPGRLVTTSDAATATAAAARPCTAYLEQIQEMLSGGRKAYSLCGVFTSYFGCLRGIRAAKSLRSATALADPAAALSAQILQRNYEPFAEQRQ